MTVAGQRKGWCPGVHRPMLTGDGLLVRLRITQGALTAETASAIARLAARHGNGAIDLTQRANLQLRGVRDESLPALTDGLFELGLLDPTVEAEAARNVLVSPLMGLDPSCANAVAIVQELEQGLQRDQHWQGLPAKFNFSVDGGGYWPLGETGADIALVAAPGGQFWQVRLAGSNHLSSPVGSEHMGSLALQLARLFISARTTDYLLRMRDLVARDDVARLLGAVGLEIGASACVSPVMSNPGVGVHHLDQAAVVAAIGLPFGRIEALQLEDLAMAAESGSSIRLTPWRMLVISCSDAKQGQALLTHAAKAGLAVSADDVRVMIDACTGAPACANASVPARDDAAMIARRLGRVSVQRGAIHISGCAKGCAHRGTAKVTLVGRDGRYDLIENGAAADTPMRRNIAQAELTSAVLTCLSAQEAAP